MQTLSEIRALAFLFGTLRLLRKDQKHMLLPLGSLRSLEFVSRTPKDAATPQKKYSDITSIAWATKTIG